MCGVRFLYSSNRLEPQLVDTSLTCHCLTRHCHEMCTSQHVDLSISPIPCSRTQYFIHLDSPAISHLVMFADGGAPAVHAPAPHSVVLADGGAPAVLACAPPSVMLADGGAPAVLADAPHSVVLADGGAPAVHAPAPLSVMLADGGASRHLHRCLPCRHLPSSLPPPLTLQW